MAIQLSTKDLGRLAGILSQHGEWQAGRSRIDFMTDVLAGSPRKAELLSQLDLDGTPRAVADRTIQRLMSFGQDLPGREALGLLINKLIARLGDGDDATFLRELLAQDQFASPPVAAHNVTGRHGKETDKTVAKKIIVGNTRKWTLTALGVVSFSLGVFFYFSAPCVPYTSRTGVSVKIVLPCTLFFFLVPLGLSRAVLSTDNER
jgi:hypothetical protein